MDISIAGRKYTLTMGSDVDRDGMFIELVDPNAVFLMEAFYSDQTHEMTFTSSVANIPLDLVEAFIAEARLRLPPTKVANSGSN